ncbi:uncharacterized protein LOC115260661 [Aedes albopictus]|uniref:PHD-type domain-containing protein n=1 Tax=Aedes albopictus TaxID=7160 RepID=A0ABM1ZZQ6_AEDAL|nr:uncharacterized protein LOC115257700 [Aedes albopictus]XP_029717664.1 uncharacterized protein LOC115260661 [Aedes albopictus]
MECKKCLLPVVTKDQPYIYCNALCAAIYHAACVGLNTAELAAVSPPNKNSCWMCDVCLVEFVQWRKEHSEKMNEPIAATVPEPTYVLQRDVDELKAKVASILSVITSHENNHSDTRICHSTPNSSRQKEEGTSEISNAFDTASRLPDSICDDENFDLLLTNIDGSVSEEDVHLMVSRCLGTFENERINVRKLVPRWVDCSALDYVSFKIVLNRKWKSAAMMSSTWPKNIRFREFKKLRCPWKPDVL